MQTQDRLKSLYSRGNFGAEFIETAKDELPYLWGRMSLLEEFYSCNAPGNSDRSRMVSDQLGRPQLVRRGILQRLREILVG